MLIPDYLKEFTRALEGAVITDGDGREKEQDASYQEAVKGLKELRERKGNLYLIGNGGSSGVISHASVDFLNQCSLRAVPLTDNSQLTCFANDYGYENVFSTPLEKSMSSEDALIAVSSSGTSKNIVNGARKARELGAYVITYSGFKEANPLRSTGDLNFWLDVDDYGKVELGHALLIHILTDELSKALKDRSSS